MELLFTVRITIRLDGRFFEEHLTLHDADRCVDPLLHPSHSLNVCEGFLLNGHWGFTYSLVLPSIKSNNDDISAQHAYHLLFSRNSSPEELLSSDKLQDWRESIRVPLKINCLLMTTLLSALHF